MPTCEPGRTSRRTAAEPSGRLTSFAPKRSEAARRVSPGALAATRDRLERIALIAITTDTYRRAGELDPGVLRSLDAIHLAAALSMGDDLEGIVTYDARFEEAALALGLPTIAP